MYRASFLRARARSENKERCVENPQPGVTVLEKTDEEIWRAIRDLDPDQPSYTKDMVCVIVIVVACVVWYCLIFAASN